MIELLSPAGTLECGLAAFQYGADAVYLGMKEFSARADAGNFSFEELSVLVGVAHQVLERRRKVYVAVNTLVREAELGALVELLCRLRDADVDALIVQDAAVAEIVARYGLGLELHASTQMAIHNADGVRQAQRLGFTRVVAAREVGINELAAMSAVPGMEVEAFIHGALCYSYSGLCLMSACTNGCSGNRGECTYVCRKHFELESGNGRIGASCPMSMKDLALVDALSDMRRAGVCSLKIEGRKKSPLYVAAVTNLYRKLLDKSFRNGEEQEAKLDVKTIFSRPWTELFARRLRNPEVTDPLVLGPRGIEVGQVARVRRAEGGDWLRFTVRNRPLEKHDGLQLELPGVEKPYGFGIDEMRCFKQGGRDCQETLFEAAPGSIIEVPLPEGHPDIPVGAKICCASSQAVKRKYKWPEARSSLWRHRHPAKFALKVAPGRILVEMQVTVCGRLQPPVQVEMEASLSPARQPERLAEEAANCFARLGDSPFSLDGITCDNPENLFLPKAMLNELRRQVVAQAEAAMQEAATSLAGRIQEEIAQWKAPVIGPEEKWSLKLDSIKTLEGIGESRLRSLDELVFSLERFHPENLGETLAALEKRMGGKERIRLSLPVICRGRGAAQWAETVRSLASCGWRRWELSNIGALQMVDGLGLELTADWPLYAMNATAARFWLEHGLQAVTAAPEDTADNLLALAARLGDRLVVPVFQHTVLARSAVCVMSSARGFCPGKAACDFTRLDMKASRGEAFAAINNDCQSVIVNQEPLDYAGLVPELRRAGASRFRLECLWLDFTPRQVEEMLPQGAQLWDRSPHESTAPGGRNNRSF